MLDIPIRREGESQGSPFGKGDDPVQAAIAVLKSDQVPSREEMSDERLRYYLSVDLGALEEHVSNREKKHTPGSQTSNAFVAHHTFVVQGLRLLILERIVKARNAQPLPNMADWLRIIKISPAIVDKLNAAGIAMR